MSDGTYCKDCHRYVCVCALTDEAVQMRKERDKARDVARRLLYVAKCAQTKADRCSAFFPWIIEYGHEEWRNPLGEDVTPSNPVETMEEVDTLKQKQFVVQITLNGRGTLNLAEWTKTLPDALELCAALHNQFACKLWLYEICNGKPFLIHRWPLTSPPSKGNNIICDAGKVIPLL